MTKKILIIGAGVEGKSTLHIASLQEKYGNDIVLVTPEEAKEQGLRMEDFANIPTIKLIAPPVNEDIQRISLSGREQRRQRRKKERKTH